MCRRTVEAKGKKSMGLRASLQGQGQPGERRKGEDRRGGDEETEEVGAFQGGILWWLCE